MDVRTGSKSWGYSKRPRNWKKIMYRVTSAKLYQYLPATLVDKEAPEDDKPEEAPEDDKPEEAPEEASIEKPKITVTLVDPDSSFSHIQMEEEEKINGLVSQERSSNREELPRPLVDRLVSQEQSSNLPQLGFQENPQSYRLAQISKIKKYFEEEIEFRRSIFSKYKKAFNVITGITHGLNAVSAVAGSATVASFAGVITSPVGIGLGAVTIATSVLSVGLIHEKKCILKKVGKHEKITTLAISKLNTINDLVSKALMDSTISAEEFSLILKEKEKYIILKNKIRKNLLILK